MRESCFQRRTAIVRHRVAGDGTSTVEPDVAHLRHFATHPAWARRGVGRTIYQLCESTARSAGVNTLECYASLNAEAFYSALGFKGIRGIDIDLGPDVVLPAVLMRREI